MAEATLDRPALSTALRLEIQALTAEHAYRLDHGAADTLHQLYSADGRLLGLPPRDLVGREAIAAWGAERVKLPRVSRHVETNHRLWWSDEGLCGTLYASVFRSETPDAVDTTPLMVGDYEDLYVKEDGEWRIRRRVIRKAF